MNDPVFHVGTSGFSYDEWRPAFYPERLKKADMLRFYAEQLGAVELNNTFFRMPTAAMVERWCAQVPASFRFAIKAPRVITWSKRLVDCEQVCGTLFEMLQPLGERLGCVFYHVPKFVPCDVEVLRRFLRLQPDHVAIAFDFVHESWRDEAVSDSLREHPMATAVVTDTDDVAAPAMHAPSSCAYVRLRRATYSADDLAAWRSGIAASGAQRAFVFFKHEATCRGPAFARRFLA